MYYTTFSSGGHFAILGGGGGFRRVLRRISVASDAIQTIDI